MDISEGLTAFMIAGMIVINVIVMLGLLIIFYMVSGLIVDYLHINGLYGLISRIAIIIVGLSIFFSPTRKGAVALAE